MTLIEQAQARTLINVADEREIARMADATGLVSREQIEDMLEGGPLILDGLRRRPRYFDGRFLTGADLTRDQDYVRQRQADMASAGGTGVIRGLKVRNRSLLRGQTLRISAGVGLTPSGDLVMLKQDREVPLMDLPTVRQLDAALGLAEEPRVPIGRRTGLFILALRPVEFTANPIAAYPRTISGERTVEDGDIIEATAITLIPFPDAGGSASLADARRRVARQIFTGEPSAMPQDALPLAMIAVERGAVRWVDTAMVRREVGADSGVHVLFGGRPRAMAEAHVVQHRAHLNDTLDDLAARGLPPTFPASQAFSILPAAGQLPATAIRADDFGFNQIYFPPGVDVDLAFVPADEVAALVEESLSLPPIDLEADAADLDATGVVIMVPVSRPRFQRFAAALSGASTKIAGAAGAVATRPAFDLLSTLVAKRRKLAEAASRNAETASSAQAEALKVQGWHAALQEAIAALPTAGARPPLLWYARRRSVAQQTRVTGTGVVLSGDDVAVNALVNANIDRLSLARRVAAITAEATPQATARLMTLLGSRAVARSDVLTVSVLADLEKLIEPSTEAPTTPVIGGTPVVDRAVSLRALRAGTAVSVNPAVLSRLQPASAELATAREGLTRLTIADAAGLSTAARADTELKLADTEVMAVAQDYSDPRLGDGLDRMNAALPDAGLGEKGAVWLGESGRALAVDAAFRAVAGEKTADFAELLKKAVGKKDAEAIDKLLTEMD